MALRYENKEYVLETELVDVDPETATPEEIASYQKHSDDATKVACIMIATMNPELQRIYEDYWPFEMHKELAEKFRKQERIERCEVVKDFTNSKPKDGESICAHVQRMQGYVERLRKLMMPVPEELAIDIVLNSLPSSYDQFRLAYHLNNNQANLTELHRMLRVAEDGMKGKSVPSVNQPVLAIGSGKRKKRKGPPKQNWREKVQVGSSSNGSRTKSSQIPCVANPDEANCFYCKEKGHWKRSCPKYLQDVKDGKVKPSTAGIYTISKNSPSSNSWVLDTGCGFHICSDLQGLKESSEVEHGRLNLIMGNRRSSPVTKIGVYSLVLSSDVRHSVNYIDSTSGVEKACLWHSRLGHISKKRIAQLQEDGVLESFDLRSDDVCESCLLGKMTKSPFKGSFERVRVCWTSFTRMCVVHSDQPQRMARGSTVIST
ncbi:hypothetical protein L2E82_19546 [Cichorium intybus]|uniref:Uncharacterized protein n=1 Tax=Cichorium intybus TaxID=13427 RepID=A0ACB9FDF0_CICIN|nr:hypothetical protein L2E82_19546 [Cichorium intybus]